MTNTQTVVDAPHKDLRRARAAALSLIPTTTGSATAIGLIFPELEGKLNGLAVRVPLLNASLTDCVFEVARPTTVEEVNGLLARAAPTGRSRASSATRSARSSRSTIKDDPRSAIVDALSTMVVDETQVKILAWYDNEWGYANRLVELARGRGRAKPSASGHARRRARHRSATGDLRNYALVTGAYWADTLTDGAIRMLVLFYFYELGYSPVRGRDRCSSSTRSSASSPTSSAAGSPRASGCKATLVMGLAMQVVALLMLGLVPELAGSSSPT